MTETTRRRDRLLTGLARGETYAEIAADLCIAPITLRNYASHLHAVVGVQDRAALVAHAYCCGWLTLAAPNETGPDPLPLHLHHVLRHMANGLTNRQIARRLGITERRARTYSAALRRRLGARHRAHAVALGFEGRHLIAPQTLGWPHAPQTLGWHPTKPSPLTRPTALAAPVPTRPSPMRRSTRA